MDPSELKIGTVLRANKDFYVMQRVVKISKNKWKVLGTKNGLENDRSLGVGKINYDAYFEYGYSIDESYIIDQVLNKYQ